MPENIKTEIQYLLEIKEENLIAEQLQKINDLFLTQYKLHIDNIDIIPLETEIYYHKDNQAFEDKMIHKNELQKNRFGQLYFHRYKKNDKINHSSGGIDVCLSKSEDYYLSVLLRTIKFIKPNKEGKLEEKIISGINNIQEIFYYEIISRIISNLEKREDIIKENKNKPVCNIYSQKRIQGNHYEKDKCDKDGKVLIQTYNLNSLNLGEKIDGEYSYLKELKSGFYTDERKKDIKKKFK